MNRQSNQAMKILKFESEEDYNRAMDALIRINEEYPPEPVKRNFVLVAGDLQSNLLKAELESLGVSFVESPTAEFNEVDDHPRTT